MKNSRILLILLGFGLAACAKDNTPDCKVVDAITVPTTCYDPSSGLTLTASGFGKNSSGFEWSIYPQADTAAYSLSENKKTLQLSGQREVFTVPDTLLRRVPGFVVKVATNCDGVWLQSIYYAVVKRKGNSGNCAVWALQKRP